MKSIISILFLFIYFLATGQDHGHLEPRYELLKVNDSMQIDNSRIITFLGVLSDSRCPKGIECVWEGQAKIKIRMRGIDKPFQEKILTVRPGNDYPLDMNETVYIEGLLPIPTIKQKIKPEDYTLAIGYYPKS
ncbi:hypothetical protein GCM10009117_20070 [Gangjinia marincola]|uniref:Uncharacterized protein n=1 Tax=Gangjinia marincola TaxID=578463 RepID=A0ABP3XUE3_9FLAO